MSSFRFYCFMVARQNFHMSSGKEPAPPGMKKRYHRVVSAGQHSYQLPTCSQHTDTDTVHLGRSFTHYLAPSSPSLSLHMLIAVTTIDMKAPPSGHSFFCLLLFHANANTCITVRTYCKKYILIYHNSPMTVFHS